MSLFGIYNVYLFHIRYDTHLTHVLQISVAGSDAHLGVVFDWMKTQVSGERPFIQPDIHNADPHAES